MISPPDHLCLSSVGTKPRPSPNGAASFSLHRFLIHLSLPFLSPGTEFAFAVGGIHPVLRIPHGAPCRQPWLRCGRPRSHAGGQEPRAERRGPGRRLYLLAHFMVQLSDALVGPVLPKGGQNVAESIRSEEDGNETSAVERAPHEEHDVPSSSAHRKCLQKKCRQDPRLTVWMASPKLKQAKGKAREGTR